MNNENNNHVTVTTGDRLMKAWENSMELVRDFESYSKEISDDKNVAGVFAQFAEDEALHASKFRDLLLENQSRA